MALIFIINPFISNLYKITYFSVIYLQIFPNFSQTALSYRLFFVACCTYHFCTLFHTLWRCSFSSWDETAQQSDSATSAPSNISIWMYGNSPPRTTLYIAVKLNWSIPSQTASSWRKNGAFPRPRRFGSAFSSCRSFWEMIWRCLFAFISTIVSTFTGTPLALREDQRTWCESHFLSERLIRVYRAIRAVSPVSLLPFFRY